MSSENASNWENYRVTGASYGPYPRGSVIPRFALIQNSDVESHIANGMLERTADPINVTIAPPKTTDATAAEATNAAIVENNQLRGDLARVTQEAKDAVAKYEEQKRQCEALTAELAEKVTEVDRLRRLAADEKRGRETAETANHGLREETGRLRDEVAGLKIAAEKATEPVKGESKDSPPKPDAKPVANATKRTELPDLPAAPVPPNLTP